MTTQKAQTLTLNSLSLTLSHSRLHFGHACVRSQRSSIAPLPLLGLWPSRNIATQKHLNEQPQRTRTRSSTFLFELFYEFYWLLLATRFEFFKTTLAMQRRNATAAWTAPATATAAAPAPPSSTAVTS